MKYKITVRHWLNERLKKTDKGYPVYVQLTFQRKNYQFRSLFIPGRCKSLDHIPSGVKNAEEMAIKDYVNSLSSNGISVKGFKEFMSNKKSFFDAEVTIKFQIKNLGEKEDLKKVSRKAFFIEQLIKTVLIGDYRIIQLQF